MTINRVRVDWAGGGVVGPGVSTFYMDPAATTGPGDLVTFFGALTTDIPSGCIITVPNYGDAIDEATGAITGTWTGTGGAAVVCTGTGNYARSVGASVKWTTAGIHNRRHVSGRTFLCPLIALVYDTSGDIASGTHNAILTAAGNLVLVHPGVFMIWSRPKGATPGAATPILGASVPFTPTALRSRRY